MVYVLYKDGDGAIFYAAELWTAKEKKKKTQCKQHYIGISISRTHYCSCNFKQKEMETILNVVAAKYKKGGQIESDVRIIYIKGE